MEEILKEVIGTKDRTVEGYGIIMAAVKYIYDHNEEVFLSLDMPWDQMINEFLPGKFRDAIRASHPEISRPDLVLKNYLRDVAKILVGLTISEVTRITMYKLEQGLILKLLTGSGKSEVQIEKIGKTLKIGKL